MTMQARLEKLERRQRATRPAWRVRIYRPGELPEAPADGEGVTIWIPDNGRDAPEGLGGRPDVR